MKEPLKALYGTKFMMLLIAIIIPILDLFLYKTHLLNIPMTIRCAYVLVLLPCFLFSFALWFDDILKYLKTYFGQ